MKKILFILFLMILALPSLIKAEENQTILKEANAAYMAKEYDKAANAYLKIYEQGQTSSSLCYNLGNCYFKQNNFANAILWFERAKRLSPNDEDIDFNLNVARLKIIDKIDVLPDLFFVSWWKFISGMFSLKVWAILSIMFFILLLCLFAYFLITSSYIIRKFTFWGTTIMLFIFIISFSAALQLRSNYISDKEAIIMAGSVNVKSSPDENSTLLFVVHEGLKVKITDKIGNWTEVKLANGNKGWIKAEEAEVI